MAKDWNVFVYMAGDNDLSDEMVWGLQEMNRFVNEKEKEKEKEKRFKPHINLVAQYDPFGSNPRVYDFTKSTPNSTGSLEHYFCEQIGDTKSKNRRWETVAREALRNVPGDVLPQSDADRKDLVGKFSKVTDDMAEQTAAALGGGISELEGNLEGLLKQYTHRILEPSNTRAELQSFVIEQVGELEPADHQIVVLSGHGSGMAGNFLSDSDPRSALSIEGIARFLELLRIGVGKKAALVEDGAAEKLTQTWWEVVDWESVAGFPKIDILGLDSCLMSMIEVAYQVRNQAKFLVGAEGYSPNTGWPYDRLLDLLLGGASAEDVATGFVDKYTEFYKDYQVAGTSTDMVAVKLGKNIWKEVKDSVKTLADALSDMIKYINEFDELRELGLVDSNKAFKNQALNRSVRDAIILARWHTQSYMAENYVDLWDFCNQLLRFLPPGTDAIRDACTGVKEAIGTVVIRVNHSGHASQHAHGLSIYFPWSAQSFYPAYRDLSFAELSGWGDFLRQYLRITRRVRRYQEKNFDNDQFGEAGKPHRYGLGCDPLDPSRKRNDWEHGTRNDWEHGLRNDWEHGLRGGKFGRRLGKNPPDGHYDHP